MNTRDDFIPLGRAVRLWQFGTSSGQAMLACAIVAFVLGMGLVSFAGWLTDIGVTSYDPLQMDIRARLGGPDAAHWMGTDKIGRDTLARVVAGTWISLSVALAVLAVSQALLAALPLQHQARH